MLGKIVVLIGVACLAYGLFTNKIVFILAGVGILLLLLKRILYPDRSMKVR